MAVRTRLTWPWRVVAMLALAAMVSALWFALSEIVARSNRKDMEDQLAAVQHESDELRTQSAELRSRNSELETELAMVKASQATLSKQTVELQNENSQLKAQLGFLQNVIGDSKKDGGVSIQRLAAERGSGDEFHFSMLVVRSVNAANDFEGNLKLQATLFQPFSDGADAAGKPLTLNLPDDAPDTAKALELKFKYYQRIEGSFRAPTGAMLKSLTVRAFETGQSKPRATQNLNLP